MRVLIFIIVLIIRFQIISTSKKVKSGIAKDAHQYFLIKENQQKKHPISIDTIPQQHVKMIDQLISDLKTDTD